MTKSSSELADPDSLHLKWNKQGNGTTHRNSWSAEDITAPKDHTSPQLAVSSVIHPQHCYNINKGTPKFHFK